MHWLPNEEVSVPSQQQLFTLVHYDDTMTDDSTFIGYTTTFVERCLATKVFIGKLLAAG